MAKRRIPSTFVCDCGHESQFGEGTVRELEALSRRRKKRLWLADSEREEHDVEFDNGHATTVICPKLGRCEITGWE